MIWIIGEYAGRIENADELLESFLETFHDETAVVQLQLLTATVKLFLKKPEGNDALVCPAQCASCRLLRVCGVLSACVVPPVRVSPHRQVQVQRVLNMATVESDNPDLRDRGYIYWRLLVADADAAKVCRGRIARV
jgi:vesicle coat complex subunit